MSNILIVEDDQMIAEIYQKKLSSAGHRAGIATNGAEAMQRIGESQYDLILIDLMLPDVNGADFLRALREGKKIGPGVKMAIWTNLNEPENKIRALEAGADGYYVKSDYSPSKLVSELESLMSGPPTPSGPSDAAVSAPVGLSA